MSYTPAPFLQLRDVAWRGPQPGFKLGLEVGGVLAEEGSRELQDAGGVGDDLYRFDAGDLVEEPSATGVHELGVAFELHQLEGRDPLIRIEIVRSMDGQECIDAFRAAIEHYRDVGVAGRVQVFEKPGGALAYQWSYGIAEPVERLAQGPSPLLIPSLPAAIAAAVGTPSLDAVRAAP